jgi:hypothetical protein
MINQIEIGRSCKSLNGKFKKFSPVHDKLLLVCTLKSVSFWGLKLTDSTVRISKLCNVVPFTQLTYLNKLSLTLCKFKVVAS